MKKSILFVGNRLKEIPLEFPANATYYCMISNSTRLMKVQNANVKVLYKDFWNVVLEESKGFFADLIMWVYYFVVCALSLAPAAVFFLLLDKTL